MISHDDLQKRAEALRFEYKQHVDDRGDPIARTLEKQFDRFYEAVQMKKNPDQLLYEIKAVQNQLQEARNSQVMSNNNLDDLYDRTEELKQVIQELR